MQSSFSMPNSGQFINVNFFSFTYCRNLAESVFRSKYAYGLEHVLLNDKEFCFSLIGLNSIFSTLPQSEYTSREVYSGLCLFLSIVYSVFQRCPTRDKIPFPVGQSNCKKGEHFQKFKIFQNLKFFKI
jgi:hypothetical protein